MNKFYITTSVPYVNAKPHIGFALEILQADCIARYNRLLGKDVFFLTGSDEHGIKLVQTAKKQGITPQDLAKKNSEKFFSLKNQLNLSNDDFIRTTDEKHIYGAKKLWKMLFDAGDLYKDSYEGFYCVGCEAFVLEKDLVDGKCPNHNTIPTKLNEENWFFRLSKYSEKIGKIIESDEVKIVPNSKKRETLQIIKEGLKDVSFSRPKSVLEWGIEVPNDPDHVIYVWGDALSNYLNGIGFYDDNEFFNKFWPADIHLIGKDILRFHSLIWIGMLLSSGLSLPKNIYVHGFVTSEGKKMSKSLNNVVDPLEYVEKYGVDALRCYLFKEIPTTDDGDFSADRFNTVYLELAHNIGNLVSRVTAMANKYFNGIVPKNTVKNDDFALQIQKYWDKFDSSINSFDLKKALEVVFELGFFANKYVEDSKPWVIAKENPEKLDSVMYDLLEMIRHIGLMLLPFLPESAEKILSFLGVDSYDLKYDDVKSWGGLLAGNSIKKAEPLFVRVGEDQRHP